MRDPLPATATADAAGAALGPIRRHRRLTRARVLRAAAPYLLIAPALVVIVAILGYPVYFLARLSFERYGLPEGGTCTLRLARDRRRPGRWVARPADGLEAETRFRRLGGTAELALAGLWPRTGRTHQIRAHLAALGAPIAGDRLYGGPMQLRGLAIRRSLLHARSLALPHPGTGALLRLLAPLPEDVAFWFDALDVVPPDD